MELEKSWVFGVAGNIIGAHTDDEGNTFYGTKAFRPRTKVYLLGKYYYEGQKEVDVIGINRFHKAVYESIPIDRIENIRKTRIFDPHVRAIMDHLQALEGFRFWGRTAEDKKSAREFAKRMNSKKEKKGLS